MENYYKPKPNFSFAELKEILVIGVAGYTDLKQLAFLNSGLRQSRFPTQHVVALKDHLNNILHKNAS
jgi:hypothetical protein